MCNLHLGIGLSLYGGLPSLWAAQQVPNVHVELFHMCEEGAYHDVLRFLQHIAYVNLLMFCGIFVEDGHQMEDGTLYEMLMCLPLKFVTFATT